MKKPSQSTISAYYNAILGVFKNDASKIENFLFELNAILMALQSVGAVNICNIDSQNFNNILKTSNISKQSIDIVSVIVQNKRLQILSVLFERLVCKLSTLTSKNIAVISCGSIKQFNEIKLLPFLQNCIVFYGKTKNILDVNVKINNKIVDISVKSKINSLKNQAVKNIENLIN